VTERKQLTNERVAALPAKANRYYVWDTSVPWMCVRIEISGKRSYYLHYSIGGHPRCFRLGPQAMGAAGARTLAKELIGDIARGKDPAAERKAKRGGPTFAELHQRYVEQHAKQHNKSWRQADYLVRSYVSPKWAKLQASVITRADVKALIGAIASKSVANQVRAAVSAVFSFGTNEEVIGANPCRGVRDHPTKSRERVLSASELAQFWAACDQINNPVKAAALKVVLLTGARPGEVCHMRWMDLRDNWWEQPGEKIEGSARTLAWPGTKNKCNHRVWLPARVREIIGETHVSHATEGYVFANRGGAYGKLDDAMREISKLCEFDPPARPHDLRRTHGSTITALGFGRESMDRILNHRKKSISDVYDRHEYSEKDKAIAERVCAHLLRLAGYSQDEYGEVLLYPRG
jgi:integrase